MGPGLADCAEQVELLAQTFDDANKGIPSSLLTPVPANCGNRTVERLARGQIVVAIDILCLCGEYNRKTAAEWVAKQAKRYPRLERLIREGRHRVAKHYPRLEPLIREGRHRDNDIAEPFFSLRRNFQRDKTEAARPCAPARNHGHPDGKQRTDHDH